MQYKNRYLYYSILPCLLFLIAIGVYVSGYNPPTQNPPLGNLPAPINAGPNSQTKAGSLTIGGNLTTGSFTMAAGAGADKVLTTNASGVATWQTASGGSLWYASGTAAAFDNDIFIGGGLYVQGQRVICPAGQNGTDSYCNNVCTTFYVQTGTEGADSTEYCYNKTALTSGNCGAVGGCKASDYTNCNSQSNNTQQYACAQCKYINTTNCSANNVLGSCTNYDSATYCAYSGWDNGATNYHCSAGTCVCDSSGYTTTPDGKDNDCDGTVDETSCTPITTGCMCYLSTCATYCAQYTDCGCTAGTRYGSPTTSMCDTGTNGSRIINVGCAHANTSCGYGIKCSCGPNKYY